MGHTLVPADASHYYQRLAELSTLPFWPVPGSSVDPGRAKHSAI